MRKKLKEKKKKLWMEKQLRMMAPKRRIMIGEGERNEDQVWIRKKSKTNKQQIEERERETKLETLWDSSCCEMHAVNIVCYRGVYLTSLRELTQLKV